MPEAQDGPNLEKLRADLFQSHTKQAWDDIQSTTDSFDRNVLALSSGALALSLGFIKDIVPSGLSHAAWRWSLYGSWFCFGLCILLTMFSFPIGIAAQRIHLKKLPHTIDEILQGKEPKQTSWAWTYQRIAIWLVAVLFGFAVILTVIFCFRNLEAHP